MGKMTVSMVIKMSHALFACLLLMTTFVSSMMDMGMGVGDILNFSVDDNRDDTQTPSGRIFDPKYRHYNRKCENKRKAPSRKELSPNQPSVVKPTTNSTNASERTEETRPVDNTTKEATYKPAKQPSQRPKRFDRNRNIKPLGIVAGNVSPDNSEIPPPGSVPEKLISPEHAQRESQQPQFPAPAPQPSANRDQPVSDQKESDSAEAHGSGSSSVKSTREPHDFEESNITRTRQASHPLPKPTQEQRPEGERAFSDVNRIQRVENPARNPSVVPEPQNITERRLSWPGSTRRTEERPRHFSSADNTNPAPSSMHIEILRIGSDEDDATPSKSGTESARESLDLNSED